MRAVEPWAGSGARVLSPQTVMTTFVLVSTASAALVVFLALLCATARKRYNSCVSSKSYNANTYESINEHEREIYSRPSQPMSALLNGGLRVPNGDLLPNNPDNAPATHNNTQSGTATDDDDEVYYQEIPEVAPPICGDSSRHATPPALSASEEAGGRGSFYDSPVPSTKRGRFGTTSSRDGFSQLAMYALEDTYDGGSSSLYDEWRQPPHTPSIAGGGGSHSSQYNAASSSQYSTGAAEGAAADGGHSNIYSVVVHPRSQVSRGTSTSQQQTPRPPPSPPPEVPRRHSTSSESEGGVSLRPPPAADLPAPADRDSPPHDDSPEYGYEYAEPGEGNGYYGAAAGLAGNPGGALPPVDSDGGYTEQGGVRYDFLTMRPRINPDQAAREMPEYSRFGQPYSCVHLYINEDVIKAHEDHYTPPAGHIYDMPPSDTGSVCGDGCSRAHLSRSEDHQPLGLRLAMDLSPLDCGTGRLASPGACSLPSHDRQAAEDHYYSEVREMPPPPQMTHRRMFSEPIRSVLHPQPSTANGVSTDARPECSQGSSRATTTGDSSRSFAGAVRPKVFKKKARDKKSPPSNVHTSSSSSITQNSPPELEREDHYESFPAFRSHHIYQEIPDHYIPPPPHPRHFPSPPFSGPANQGSQPAAAQSSHTADPAEPHRRSKVQESRCQTIRTNPAAGRSMSQYANCAVVSQQQGEGKRRKWQLVPAMPHITRHTFVTERRHNSDVSSTSDSTDDLL